MYLHVCSCMCEVWGAWMCVHRWGRVRCGCQRQRDRAIHNFAVSAAAAIQVHPLSAMRHCQTQSCYNDWINWKRHLMSRSVIAPEHHHWSSAEQLCQQHPHHRRQLALWRAGSVRLLVRTAAAAGVRGAGRRGSQQEWGGGGRVDEGVGRWEKRGEERRSERRRGGGGARPGCPIWLWMSSMLISAGEAQHRVSAGSQWWLPESEQAPSQPWLRAEKGKMRSSSWEL